MAVKIRPRAMSDAWAITPASMRVARERIHLGMVAPVAQAASRAVLRMLLRREVPVLRRDWTAGASSAGATPTRATWRVSAYRRPGHGIASEMRGRGFGARLLRRSIAHCRRRRSRRSSCRSTRAIGRREPCTASSASGRKAAGSAARKLDGKYDDIMSLMGLLL
jgi:GNAT superfamily N-acetyltransferase